ncbi:hypothetical protein MUK42_13421 [Musa troglodytarum]|uniref:Uncharacterized protein n=1 Tax=Musa troglodytarum TaxID=320322 RepID=A0A9E7GUV6_9LILI|nr:hypothetical protein MUK42_13421 [Musa troglodytarum]
MQVVSSQLDTLTEQQKSAVSGLRQSSQQAEDALSQGLERLQETLSETLTCDPSGTPGVTNYMEQMANAMGKLEALVSFVTQCRTYEYVNKTRFYWLNRTITGSQNNMPTDSLENGKPIGWLFNSINGDEHALATQSRPPSATGLEADVQHPHNPPSSTRLACLG